VYFDANDQEVELLASITMLLEQTRLVRVPDEVTALRIKYGRKFG